MESKLSIYQKDIELPPGTNQMVSIVPWEILSLVITFRQQGTFPKETEKAFLPPNTIYTSLFDLSQVLEDDVFFAEGTNEITIALQDRDINMDGKVNCGM